MKYEPHEYQRYAINYIEDHPFAAVLLDMGLGKTSITLTAVADLLFDSFEVHKVLVIAPLRVARDTWSAELQKWDQLHHLTYSVAVGSEAERKAALTKKADIYIINRENVQWLIEKSKLPFDYDMLVVDELSSFKNHQSKRFKALMQVRPRIKRVVGLTGTPASNGLMDLWAEFKVIDMGKRLGRFITYYRQEYFVPDAMNGQIVYSYRPKPGAEQAIYRKISDITISMKSTDHLKMPELISSEYKVYLSPDEQDAYDEMKKQFILILLSVLSLTAYAIVPPRSVADTARYNELRRAMERAQAQPSPASSPRWPMVPFTTMPGIRSPFTSRSWTLWRTLSSRQTASPFWWPIGTSTIWSGS